jgi:hypothetical protein
MLSHEYEYEYEFIPPTEVRVALSCLQKRQIGAYP